MDDDDGQARVVLYHNPPSYRVKIPFALLEEVVGSKMLSDRMTILEDMTGAELVRRLTEKL